MIGSINADIYAQAKSKSISKGVQFFFQEEWLFLVKVAFTSIVLGPYTCKLWGHKVLTSNQTAWHRPSKISRSIQKEASAFEQDLDRRWHQKRETVRTKVKKLVVMESFSATAFPKLDSRLRGQISDHCLLMTWGQSECWACLWGTWSLGRRYRLEFKSLRLSIY